MSQDSPFLPSDVRAHFPGVRDKIYLDVAISGLLPQPVADAAQQHINERLLGTGDKSDYQAAVERSRELFAELLGADADEVAITKNVSEALNLFASSLPWKAGQNVVLCPDLEHPNNVFLWYNLHRLRGIEVRAVEPDGGRIPVQAMSDAMNEDTALVTLPHVTLLGCSRLRHGRTGDRCGGS